jgi:hypothetical protein
MRQAFLFVASIAAAMVACSAGATENLATAFVSQICNQLSKGISTADLAKRLGRTTRTRINSVGEKSIELNTNDAALSKVVITTDTAGAITYVMLALPKARTPIVSEFQQRFGKYEVGESTDTTIPWLLTFSFDTPTGARCTIDAWLQGNVDDLPNASIGRLDLSLEPPNGRVSGPPSERISPPRQTQPSKPKRKN